MSTADSGYTSKFSGNEVLFEALVLIESVCLILSNCKIIPFDGLNVEFVAWGS